jgi:hypothetical protein
MQEGDLPLIFLENHDQRVRELVRLAHPNSHSVGQIPCLPANKADQMLPGVITQHNTHNQESYPKNSDCNFNCSPSIFLRQQENASRELTTFLPGMREREMK